MFLRAPLAALSLPVLLGCTNGETLAFTQQSPLSTPATPLAALADCPTLAASLTATAEDGSRIVMKACVKDEHGNYYAVPFSDNAGAGPLVVPPGPKYAFVYEFGTGWTPAADSLGTAVSANGMLIEGAIPGGSAAEGGSGGAQNGTAQAMPAGPNGPLASTSALDGNVLTQTLADAPASHYWIFSTLNLAAMFPSYFAAHANWAPGGLGFSSSFVVGDVAGH
jgi:hypothetical protein